MDVPELDERTRELAAIMAEFEGTHFHAAITELMTQAEFAYLTDMISCPKEDLSIKQAKIQGLKEAIGLLKVPELTIENYKHLLEQEVNNVWE